jgi:hypothetical protein
VDDDDAVFAVVMPLKWHSCHGVIVRHGAGR